MIKAISQLSVSEWCDYWREGNDQHLRDGIEVNSEVRSQLAQASATIQELTKIVESLPKTAASDNNDQKSRPKWEEYPYRAAIEARERFKSHDEILAEEFYGDRALSGPDALYRSCKDWGG